MPPKATKRAAEAAPGESPEDEAAVDTPTPAVAASADTDKENKAPPAKKKAKVVLTPEQMLEAAYIEADAFVAKAIADGEFIDPQFPEDPEEGEDPEDVVPLEPRIFKLPKTFLPRIQNTMHYNEFMLKEYRNFRYVRIAPPPDPVPEKYTPRLEWQHMGNPFLRFYTEVPVFKPQWVEKYYKPPKKGEAEPNSWKIGVQMDADMKAVARLMRVRRAIITVAAARFFLDNPLVKLKNLLRMDGTGYFEGVCRTPEDPKIDKEKKRQRVQSIKDDTAVPFLNLKVSKNEKKPPKIYYGEIKADGYIKKRSEFLTIAAVEEFHLLLVFAVPSDVSYNGVGLDMCFFPSNRAFSLVILGKTEKRLTEGGFEVEDDPNDYYVKDASGAYNAAAKEIAAQGALYPTGEAPVRGEGNAPVAEDGATVVDDSEQSDDPMVMLAKARAAADVANAARS